MHSTTSPGIIGFSIHWKVGEAQTTGANSDLLLELWCRRTGELSVLEMKLGFWSGQRKSTLWCFWFYFSKALKVIITCRWIPVAVALPSFISGLQSFSQRTGSIQARPAGFNSGTSWRQLGLWLEDHVYARLENSDRQAALGEGWWWPGGENTVNHQGCLPLSRYVWAVSERRTHCEAAGCPLSPSLRHDGSPGPWTQKVGVQLV